MQPILVAGAHLKCYINGRLFGTVTAMGFNVITAHEKRREIDNPETVEHVPTIFDLQGTFGLLRARDGGLEGQGIVPFGREIPRAKYLTIELLDRITGQIIFRATEAVVTAQQWQVQAKGLMTGSFTFEASGFSNEADV